MTKNYISFVCITYDMKNKFIYIKYTLIQSVIINLSNFSISKNSNFYQLKLYILNSIKQIIILGDE